MQRLRISRIWKFSWRVLGILCVLPTAPVFSSPITITNPSFEIHDPFNRPCISTNCYNITDPVGWTRANGPFQGQFAPDSTFFLNLSLPDGSVVAYSNGGSLYQTLAGQSAAANTGYLLQVAIGRRFDCCNGLANGIPGIPDTPAMMDIELRAGGVAGTLLAINTIDIRAIPLGSFANFSAFFAGAPAPPAGNLTIVLNTTGIEGLFDNVRLDSLTSTQVPEPGSVTMVLAAIGLFWIRRPVAANRA